MRTVKFEKKVYVVDESNYIMIHDYETNHSGMITLKDMDGNYWKYDLNTNRFPANIRVIELEPNKLVQSL